MIMMYKIIVQLITTEGSNKANVGRVLFGTA